MALIPVVRVNCIYILYGFMVKGITDPQELTNNINIYHLDNHRNFPNMCHVYIFLSALDTLSSTLHALNNR